MRANVAESYEAPPVAADPTLAANPELLARTAEHRRAILAALDQLPAEQRTLIDAAYFEGYTQSELADRFDLPLGTVKTQDSNGDAGVATHAGSARRRLVARVARDCPRSEDLNHAE